MRRSMPRSMTVMGALQTSGWGGTLAHRHVVRGAHRRQQRHAAAVHADEQPTIDCDTAPIPVPPGGHIEGVTDYSCSGGDCHLLVYQGTRLYELYQADITGGMATGGTFSGNCLVVWDLTKDYWANPATVGASFSRGDGCNGADAGDMPMATLILKTVGDPGRRRQPRDALHDPEQQDPRERLRASGDAPRRPVGRRDDDCRTARACASRARSMCRRCQRRGQIVAAALKKYGMFLADGGNPYVSATDDIASVIAPSALRGLSRRTSRWSTAARASTSTSRTARARRSRSDDEGAHQVSDVQYAEAPDARTHHRRGRRVLQGERHQEGMLLVSAMHITAAVFINDDEPGLHADIEEWVQRLAPGPSADDRKKGPDYQHHASGEDNGDAHLKNLLIGHQVIVPITAGQARPRAVAADLLLRIRRPAAEAARDEGDGRVAAARAVSGRASRWSGTWCCCRWWRSCRCWRRPRWSAYVLRPP